MRVLWTVNLIPAAPAESLGLRAEVLGGWVEAMAAELRKDDGVALAIACKTEREEPFQIDIGGICYYSLNYTPGADKGGPRKRCEEIIRDFEPDLIHIEGTEFPHAGVMMEAGEKAGIPAAVSLQGILNGQYDHQCGHLPIDDMMWRPKTAVSAWLLHLRKTRWYRPRMKPERELLSKARYFLGRTTWDRAHAYFLNPQARYFHCDRNLREPFYHTQWAPETMERHSIYVGSGYYALKGLHFAVRAVALLCREYPDIRLYVAGEPPYSEKDRRPLVKRGYGLYLKGLIRELGVEKRIVFTGPLQADEVAERLARVNAYVLCSVGENSPNTLGEAMMVGTPCVASYVGGAPDMVADGEEALVYRDDDPVMLAWCVKRIFDSDELAESLSKNARARASKTHDPQKNAAALYRAYQDILYGNESE